jgi:hypothetical protein
MITKLCYLGAGDRRKGLLSVYDLIFARSSEAVFVVLGGFGLWTGVLSRRTLGVAAIFGST